VSWKQSREPASRLSSSTQGSRWCRSNKTSTGSKWSSDLLRKHGGKTGEELKAERALLNAAFKGNIEALKKHLDDGVDVNAMWDSTGMTPLHSAARLGHIKIVELLVAEGGDVNVKSKFGETPLD
jgi:hypothetical protein